MTFYTYHINILNAVLNNNFSIQFIKKRKIFINIFIEIKVKSTESKNI